MKKKLDFKKIGQQLNDATQRPSENAWQNMTKLLDKEVAKPRKINWLAIASAVVLLLSAFWLWMPKKSNLIIKQEVVEIDGPKSDPINQTKIYQEDFVTSTQTVSNKKVTITTKNSQKSNIQPHDKQEIGGESLVQKNFKPAFKDSLQPIVNEVVLLNNQPQIKINPNDLLNIVEKELDEEHKYKTLKTLENKLKNLKETVVNRNYEP